MDRQKLYHLACLLAVAAIVQTMLTIDANAQDREGSTPEMSVVGIELGNRVSAEKFLTEGHHPQIGADGRASFYFYNVWGSQVMRLTAPSAEDKYFITEIEVFRVSRKYRKCHYMADEVKYFQTEGGVFIGFKQSAMYFLAAIENAGSINRFRPKNLIKIKGEPVARSKTGKKSETLVYRIPGITLSDKNATADYEAQYVFYKNKLKSFTLKISPVEKNLAREKKKSPKL